MAEKTNAFVESTGRSTTTSTSVGGANKASLVHTPGDNETWAYFWSCTLDHSATNSDANLRLRNETAAADWANANVEAKDTTNLHPMGGIKVHTYGASPGSQTIDIDFWAEAGTSGISDASIFGLKLDTSKDFEANAEGANGNTSSTYETAVTLNQTLNGNYAIFLSCEWISASTTGRCNVRADHGGTKYGLNQAPSQDVTNWRTWSHMIVLEGLSGSQTITIEFASANNATNVQVRKCRILALNLDQFNDYATDADRADDTNTTTTPEVQSSLVFTPAAARNHVLFACAIVEHSINTANMFARFAESGGTTYLEAQEEPVTNGSTMPFFVVTRKSPSVASHTYETLKWTETASNTATMRESAILIIDLEEAAAAGPVTIAVPLGSLTAASSAPVAHKDDIIAVAAGALTFTGLAPVSNVNNILPVPLGSLTFNGFAPTLGRGVPVPLGQLTANGFAPTIEIDVVSAVPVGTLTANAFVPVVIVAQVIIVPAGQLTMNGFAPTMEIDVVAAVPAGVLTATGFAPTNEFDIVVVIPAGSLSLTGFAPSSVVSFVVSVPAGALSANGFAPSIEIDVLIKVPVGVLTANGFAPSSEIDVVIVIPAGLLTAAADPPSIFVATIAAVPAGSLTASGFMPSIEIDVVAAVPVGMLTLTGLAPALSEDQIAQPPAGELTLTGFVPAVDIDVLVSPGVGTLLMTGFAPAADIDVLVMTLTGTLTADGLVPEALISGAIEIPRGQLTAVGHQPSALLASLISVPVGNLSLTGLVAAVLRIINPKPSPSRTIRQGNTSRTVQTGGARTAKTTGLREIDT